jgi:hypothetical protein
MASRNRSLSDSQVLSDDVKHNGVTRDTITSSSNSKEKKLTTLGRLLRPWKWRRKKKSKQFEDTSTTLERKLSVRSQRKELVRRGLLRPEDVPEEPVAANPVNSGAVKRPPIPPEKPARSQATTALLAKSGVGQGEDRQKAASDGNLRESLNGVQSDRGVRFTAAVGSIRTGEGEFPRLISCPVLYSVCGNVAERTSVMEETKKRPFPTPALPSSPTRNVKLNPRVGVLTGQPRDNTAPPEVESSDPEDNQTEEQTEEDEEEDEEADMPQSGEMSPSDGGILFTTGLCL